MLSNKNVNRLFCAMVVIYVGVSLLSGVFISMGVITELPIYVSLLISQALVLVPPLVYCGIKKVPVRELIPFRKMKFSVWVLIVVCTYLMYPLLIVLNAITLVFVESGTTELLGITKQVPFLVASLMMAVLPAFSEEFLFRGMLFGTYKKSKMMPAIFLSAFLFGCMHLNFNQFLYAFMLGIYMAFLVEATGSILSSMLAHFTLNFTSVIVSYGLPWLLGKVNYPEQVPGLEQQVDTINGNLLEGMDKMTLLFFAIGIFFWAIIAIGTTAGAIGVYVAIAKISGRMEHVKTMFRKKTKERVLTVPVLVAIAIMLAVIIWQAVG